MKTKSISIPKDIFEKNFLFQKGGTKEREKVHKSLTGEYAFGIDSENNVNSELEDGEFLQDSAGIKEVEGKKHSEGGEKMALEDGTRILSDYLKVGARNAKVLNDQFDLGVKASDTYATVVEKFNKKSGLNKIKEELEEYIAKLDKQQQETKDETTLALNTQYLTEEINEEFEKKKPLEAIREQVFDLTFKLQEASKPAEKDKEEFQTGGTMTYNGDTVIQLANKYGINPDKAKELIAKFQTGGLYDVPQDTRGNIYSPLNPNNPLFFGQIPQPITNQRVANAYEKEKYGYQKPNRDWKDFGELNKNEQASLLSDIGRVFPTLAEKFLKEGVPKNPSDFQKAVNNHYETLKTDAKKLYPEGSEELNSFIKSVDKEKFTVSSKAKDFKGLVTDIDNKFGDYTSTRPNFAFDVLPKDVLTEVKNSGINTASELKQAFPDYYKKYVEPKGLSSDFWLDMVEPPKVNTPAQQQVTQAPASTSTAEGTKQKTNSNRGFLLLPDQTPMTPDSQMAHLKPNRRFETIDPVFISPERQLAEIARQQQNAYTNISMLPDQQAAAAYSVVGANTAEASNKAISETVRANAAAQESANRFNAQVRQNEENTAWQDALNYERNTYLAKANVDKSWRNFYDRINAQQINDWKYIEWLKRGDAMNTEVQYTPEGYVIAKPTFSNNPEVNRLAQGANTPTENLAPRTVKKKKYGGRFKK